MLELGENVLGRKTFESNQGGCMSSPAESDMRLNVNIVFFCLAINVVAVSLLLSQ